MTNQNGPFGSVCELWPRAAAWPIGRRRTGLLPGDNSGYDDIQTALCRENDQADVKSLPRVEHIHNNNKSITRKHKPYKTVGGGNGRTRTEPVNSRAHIKLDRFLVFVWESSKFGVSVFSREATALNCFRVLF